MDFIYLLVATIFSDNFVLSKLLGVYPVINKSNKKISIVQEGILVTISLIVMSIFSYILYTWILEPLNISYLTTILFSLILFLVAQLTVLISKKMGKYNNVGISVEQIVANSIILAAVLIGIEQEHILYSVIHAIGAGLGYTLISVLISDAMDRVDEDTIVPAFSGIPIRLIALGLMAYAFLGFNGIAP